MLVDIKQHQPIRLLVWRMSSIARDQGPGAFWYMCRVLWFQFHLVTAFNLTYIYSIPPTFRAKHLPRLWTERKTCFISIQYSSLVCHYFIEFAQPSFVIFCVGEPLSDLVFSDRSSQSSNRLGYANNYSQMSCEETLIPAFSRMVFVKWSRSLIFIHDALNRIQKFGLFLGVTVFARRTNHRARSSSSCKTINGYLNKKYNWYVYISL